MTSRQRAANLAKQVSLIAIFFTAVGTASAQSLSTAPAEESRTALAATRNDEAVGSAGIAAAIARNNEGVELAGQGRYKEAEQAFRAALEIGCEDELERAKIANNLGTLYQREDRFPEAERMFRIALELRQKNLPLSSIEVVYSLNNLAEVCRVQDRQWEARNLMERAVAQVQRSHAGDPGAQILLTNLALVLCRFNQFDQAQELLRSALNYYEKHNEATSRGYGVAINSLGQIAEAQNDFNTAALLYEQSVTIFQNLGDSARSDLAAALANAGALYERQGRVREAREAQQRAMQFLNPKGDVLLRGQVLWNLGNIAAKSDRPSDALPFFQQSLTIHEERLGPEHPVTAGLLLDYASATKLAGDKSLARKLRKRAEDLLAKIKSPGQLTVSAKAFRGFK